MLEAPGQRVHVYISPHLVRFHERIRLAGRWRRSDAGRRAGEVETVNAGAPITFFEVITAAAFLVFAAPRPTAGAGGRPRRPVRRDQRHRRARAAAITPDLHGPWSFPRRHAGEDRLREGRHPEARRARGGRAAAGRGAGGHRGARPRSARPCRCTAGTGRRSRRRMVCSWRPQAPASRCRARACRARAGWRTRGLAAIAALQLGETGLDAAAIGRGLASAVWPARLQELQPGRLAALVAPGARVWLDGGHNPAAGRVPGPQPRPRWQTVASCIWWWARQPPRIWRSS